MTTFQISLAVDSSAMRTNHIHILSEKNIAVKKCIGHPSMARELDMQLEVVGQNQRKSGSHLTVQRGMFDMLIH